ncbi:flagellar export protein FliJ [Piscibacillus halophilus]|uniref:flagellar export protein FliJ n=1 Tax=Piscibacillus halophilus TaxID=571933 RepID=UPI00158A9E81|nr:flagellar export protein FliJ [Piscibacillus halophilus]
MNNELRSIDKLLEFKEEQFNQSQAQFKRAMEYFETVGNQLYDLLKTKEKIEKALNDHLKSRIKAYELLNYQQQLDQLKKKENELQIKVHQARMNMQDKEQKRTEAHFEYKKLEKVKENRLIALKKRMKNLENQQLDEVSVQQYVRVNG